MYSHLCADCEFCFGCIGLKHKKYCILNKQYSEDEYFQNVSMILDEMVARGEWGEFFPVKYSPYGYNRSGATLYEKLTKNQALAL